MKLFVKKLIDTARLPEVAHGGTDLAYDLFAAEDVLLIPGRVTKVRTGIAIEFSPAYGAEFRDRSSIAARGIRTSGGIIDAGYRGELIVLLTLDTNAPPSSKDKIVGGYKINFGDKIVQMLPRRSETTFTVEEVPELGQTARGEGGFGSTGA